MRPQLGTDFLYRVEHFGSTAILDLAAKRFGQSVGAPSHDAISKGITAPPEVCTRLPKIKIK